MARSSGKSARSRRNAGTHDLLATSRIRMDRLRRETEAMTRPEPAAPDRPADAPSAEPTLKDKTEPGKP